jgi:large subunit ribosomal protein L28
MKHCQITGKKTRTGNSVSHSQVKTKRTFRSNIHTKKVLDPASGKMVTLQLSTNALRTLAKWDREGKRYDLKKLVQK